MTSDSPRQPSIFWWGLLFEAGLGLLAWLVGWFLSTSPLESVRFERDAVVVGLAACVPMLLLFAACVRWPIGPLRGIKDFSDEFVRPLFASCNLFQLALISLAAGIGEEMLFRGLLQRLLVGWLGVWPGIALASVLFGLMHLITVTYAVLAALMGCYLSWVLMMAHDNLLSVIIAHGVYDFLALVYLVKIDRCQEGR